MSIYEEVSTVRLKIQVSVPTQDNPTAPTRNGDLNFSKWGPNFECRAASGVVIDIDHDKINQISTTHCVTALYRPKYRPQRFFKRRVFATLHISRPKRDVLDKISTILM